MKLQQNSIFRLKGQHTIFTVVGTDAKDMLMKDANGVLSRIALVDIINEVELLEGSSNYYQKEANFLKEVAEFKLKKGE
jgi:hypothetical protein